MHICSKLLVAALSATAIAQSATAQTETVTRQVYVGDLDLTTDAGKARMTSRVKSAARAVCSSHLGITGSFIRCKRDALAGAEAQMDRAVQLASRKSEIRLASR